MSKSVLDTIAEYSKDSENLRDLQTSEVELELCDQMIELRDLAGLTQKELADKMGFTQGYIAKLENGGYDRCGIGTLRRFALALYHDINLDGFFKPIVPYARMAVRGTLSLTIQGEIAMDEPVEPLAALNVPQDLRLAA